MIAVTVTFEIDPKRRDAFLDLVQRQAKASLALEVQCTRFDICVQADRANLIFLYEIYYNRQAFDAHLQSSHFRDFDRAAANFIVHKQVDVWGVMD